MESWDGHRPAVKGKKVEIWAGPAGQLDLAARDPTVFWWL